MVIYKAWLCNTQTAVYKHHRTCKMKQVNRRTWLFTWKVKTKQKNLHKLKLQIEVKPRTFDSTCTIYLIWCWLELTLYNISHILTVLVCNCQFILGNYNKMFLVFWGYCFSLHLGKWNFNKKTFRFSHFFHMIMFSLYGMVIFFHDTTCILHVRY